MQDSDDKRYSEFTKMKSDTKKIDSDFSIMKSDINNIKKILTYIISQKHHY